MEYELDQTRDDEDHAGDKGDVGGSSILAHHQSGLGERHLPKPSDSQGRTGAIGECSDLTQPGWQTAGCTSDTTETSGPALGFERRGSVHTVSLTRQLGTVLVVVAAAGLLALSAAGASTATCKPMAAPTDYSGDLSAVAVTSACNAWAVGDVDDHTLVLHWNGRTWKRQPSPNPGVYGNLLLAVTATSATNAWAVGVHFTGIGDYGTPGRALIEHWNGVAWKVQPSPVRTYELNGVTATSSTNAWAVGVGVIEHWSGRAWKGQRMPVRGALYGVTAISPTDAWAVGSHVGGTLVLHWNGRRWHVQRSPSPGRSTGFNPGFSSVSASSATNAWAVGVRGGRGTRNVGQETLVEHWNGQAWKVQSSPNPSGSNQEDSLNAVSATSTTNAWAVGVRGGRGSPRQALVEHWDGRAWKTQSSAKSPPSPAGSVLNGVAAISATRAWAVGNAGAYPILMYWSGTTWKAG